MARFQRLHTPTHWEDPQLAFTASGCHYREKRPKQDTSRQHSRYFPSLDSNLSTALAVFKNVYFHSTLLTHVFSNVHLILSTLAFSTDEITGNNGEKHQLV